MFNRKLRRSLLLKEQMITRRNEKIEEINNDRLELRKENLALYEENKELRYENLELLATLRRIETLIKFYKTNNTNPLTLIRDIINELSTALDGNR